MDGLRSDMLVVGRMAVNYSRFFQMWIVLRDEYHLLDRDCTTLNTHIRTMAVVIQWIGRQYTAAQTQSDDNRRALEAAESVRAGL